MSIQMTLVFGALMAEMVVLFALVLPLPHAIRLNIVFVEGKLKENKNLKVLVGFISILLSVQFMDCLQRLRKYSVPINDPLSPYRGGLLPPDQLASKFYSQRNLYITGAVVYLEIAIFTVMPIIRKLVAKESEYRSLTNKGNFASEKEEVAKLKELIRRKDEDIATLKKQVNGLQVAYDGLTEDKPVDKSD